MEEFLKQIDRHRDEFYRYVHRTAWDPASVDDIFSSGVLAAWENWPKFRQGTNFRAWMYRILTNKCFVANRHTMRRPKPIDEIPERDLLSVTTSWGYADVLRDPEPFLQECGDEVLAAFKKLSEAQRACLLLRVEQFSYNEIAEIMGMPVGTVMTHLARGRARLRGELLEYAREQGIVRPAPRVLEKDDETGAGARGSEAM